MGEPPFAVTFPPVTTELFVIEVKLIVVIVGITGLLVLKVTWFPYAVPALFVA